MRIYLDNCCLQRPFDDQMQPRIRVETEAVLAVLAAVRTGEHSLLNSEASEYEAHRIDEEARREEVRAVLALADTMLRVTDDVEAHSLRLEQDGIASMDAVHLTLASAAGADYFCTCDDRLLHKARAAPGLACGVISLLNLVHEVTK